MKGTVSNSQNNYGLNSRLQLWRRIAGIPTAAPSHL